MPGSGNELVVLQTTSHEGRRYPSQLACKSLEQILQGSLKKSLKPQTMIVFKISSKENARHIFI